MHPLVRGLLSPWEWRPEVALTIGVAALFYTFGWWRVRRLSKRQKFATRWRLAAYYGGLFSLALALMRGADRRRCHASHPRGAMRSSSRPAIATT